MAGSRFKREPIHPLHPRRARASDVPEELLAGQVGQAREITVARFRQAVVAAIQSRARCSGSSLMTMSVTTAADDAPAARTSGARSKVMPPIATSGQAILARHSPMRARPCGAPGITFSLV